MNNNLIIKNAWICAPSNNEVIPVYSNMVIENGIISKITNEIKQSDLEGFDVIDANGKVLTIPNVNFHDHIYSRLAKGLPLSGSMESFTEILKNLWWKLDLILDYDMIRASAKMAAIESIKNGVSYIFDHHASPNNTLGSLKCIKEELSNFNLRNVLCFETSDRNGVSLKLDALKENINFLNKEIDENSKGMFGLHASFTLDDSTLAEIKNLIQETNTGIHIHICEDESDKIMSLKEYNQTPLERLQEFNLINDKSILAHGVHLDKTEFNSLETIKPAFVFNLDSNMNNAVGVPQLNLIPDTVSILCGTDGMHANIARSQKQYFLMLRHQKNNFSETFRLFTKMYFDQLNFVKKYFNDFTSLKIGDRADFIIWDYAPPTPINKDNFFGHYIYGILERPVNSLVQNGKVLMNNYSINNIDESEINQQLFLQGQRIVNKIR